MCPRHPKYLSIVSSDVGVIFLFVFIALFIGFRKCAVKAVYQKFAIPVLH